MRGATQSSRTLFTPRRVMCRSWGRRRWLDDEVGRLLSYVSGVADLLVDFHNLFSEARSVGGQGVSMRGRRITSEWVRGRCWMVVLLGSVEGVADTAELLSDNFLLTSAIDNDENWFFNTIFWVAFFLDNIRNVGPVVAFSCSEDDLLESLNIFGRDRTCEVWETRADLSCSSCTTTFLIFVVLRDAHVTMIC